MVDPDTLRTDVFTALRKLIIANYPSYTHGEDVFKYTLRATYPRTDPVFPMVVLNSANISLTLINLDGSGEDYEVTVQLDFFVKEFHGDKAVETGQDGLMKTFIANISEFNNTDGLLPVEDFWDDSNVTPFEEDNQILKTGSSIIKFKLK